MLPARDMHPAIDLSFPARAPADRGDVELVSLLLGPGKVEGALTLAARLLERAGGVDRLAGMSPHEIAALAKVGTDRATRVVAAIELGRRVHAAAALCRREAVGSFAAVERWASPRLSHLEHEEVWLLCLDGRNAMKSALCVARGGAHGCALTPRDLLAPALREAASAVVLVHNHPSGDPTPSAEDVHMTRAVAAACEVVGVPLLDHVVVARGGAASVFDGLDPSPVPSE
ncbi:MAG: DNA repair protein [Polyangiaceae bacterium]|nr:DNA repair protein [Polyangiaceae bacterium]